VRDARCIGVDPPKNVVNRGSVDLGSARRVEMRFVRNGNVPELPWCDAAYSTVAVPTRRGYVAGMNPPAPMTEERDLSSIVGHLSAEIGSDTVRVCYQKRVGFIEPN
jgi:hypothetical protein